MSNFDYWNKESFLSLHGYAADGSVSEVGRHIIIDKIVDTFPFPFVKIYVIEHLKWLIETRENRDNKAARIWKSDLEYVYRSVNARSTTPTRSISKL